jgi:hypothetical protein
MAMLVRNLCPSEIKENKEELQLIWLDANIDESADSVQTQTMFLELNASAQFYTDSDRCVDLIKSIKN